LWLRGLVTIASGCHHRRMPSDTFRLLVTGAAGFIGSHTVDRALEAGARVLALDDLSTGREANLAPATSHAGFSFARGDVADAAFMAAQCTAFRPHAVVHLAALVSVPLSHERPDENFRRNELATQVVARAALAAGCRRLVFASSAAVYGDADTLPIDEAQAGRRPTLSPYGAAKAASEDFLERLEAEGLTPAVLRYFNVYGPRQDPGSPYSGVVSLFVERARAGSPLVIYGDGAQTRDFVAVDDVARANLAAADPSRLWPGPCNVCTGQGVSVTELAGLVRARYPGAAIEHRAIRDGDIRHSLGDPSRLRAALGEWRPRAFAEGLAALLRAESA
jgi:UDP-glucose 4-epimerase